MWRERFLFLGIGVLIGALGFTLGRGRPAAEPAAPADGSVATIAELRQRIAALESHAPRPPELAALSLSRPVEPTEPDAGMTEAGGDPKGTGAEASASPTAEAPAPIGPTRITLLGSKDRPVYLDAWVATSTQVAAPEWSATTTDDKLRYGTDEEKAKALDVLRSVTSKDYLPVAQRALEASTDDARTRELIGTLARLKDRPWSAIQATGAPDTKIGGDLGTAWASASGDMGEVTLDLTYEKAVRVDRVRIHETHAPGAISKILAKAADGSWDVLWEGRTPALVSPNWFAPPLAATRYTTTTIRLVIDTDRVPDWNEIDAVELEGDGIRQWATGATASSSYADR